MPVAARANASAASAQEPPDLTGVWTTYRAPGAPVFGGGSTPRVGELAFTDAARARVEAYEAVTEGKYRGKGSGLEHQWTFNVSGGSTVTFVVGQLPF